MIDSKKIPNINQQKNIDNVDEDFNAAINEEDLEILAEEDSSSCDNISYNNRFLNPSKEEMETELEIVDLLSKLDEECSTLFFSKK